MFSGTTMALGGGPAGRYSPRVRLIRLWLLGDRDRPQVGRNGPRRYNNSDHSMLTAMCAVESLNEADHEVWAVNAVSRYLRGAAVRSRQ